ncbi:hypothetical protein PHLCEN_2v3309 [Hermanssonia centrifuga]|uniref:Uncharacterized protein n=1 Tax=Hermanssonia centrifuga TaxID=98765 RepID=A0A2R6QM76_9APHY|nr:hypothetical protein PHLCEN_2v3309 [Hermanssonia centrifuga]
MEQYSQTWVATDISIDKPKNEDGASIEMPGTKSAVGMRFIANWVPGAGLGMGGGLRTVGL